MHDRRVGDYRLGRQLGSGGMGVVYEAVQTSLNRKVAIKFIRDSLISSPAMLRRFTIEAEAAARLKHPNIVCVHEIGEVDGQPYFSMDLIEGESLRRKIASGAFRVEGGKVSARKTQAAIVRLMIKTAWAIHHAHERGVLHRDLKPANILVDHEGEPHLTDFGLAKILQVESDEMSSHLTTLDGIGCTPPYAAPEQVLNLPSTPCSDVYGLGAILYEMLTSRPPFQAATTREILRQVEELPPKPLRQINPAIDKDLETICLKCLEKVPHCRYSSATALAEDLDRWLNLKPIRARAAGPLRRTRQWMNRNRLATCFIASLVIGLISGAFLLKMALDQKRLAEIGRGALLQHIMSNVLEDWHDPTRDHVEIDSAQLSILSGSPKTDSSLGRLVTVGVILNADPINFAEQNAAMLTHLESDLGAALGEPVQLRLRLFKNSANEPEMLRAAEADFMVVSPLSFVEAAAAEPSLIAILREDLNQTGTFYAHTNSGITNIQQLAGKRLALPAREDPLAACAKGRLTDLGLSRSAMAGAVEALPPASDARWRYRGETVALVLNGSCDVGVTSRGRFKNHQHQGLIELESFRVADHLYVAKGGLPPNVVTEFRRARLRANQFLPPSSRQQLDPFDSDDVARAVMDIDEAYIEKLRSIYDAALRFDN